MSITSSLLLQLRPPSPSEESFSVGVSFSPVPLLVGSALLFLLLLAILPTFFRNKDLVLSLRNHLRRFAPFYLVVGPSAITYLIACGAASALSCTLFMWLHEGEMLRDYAHTQKYANTHGMYTMFHCIEYACSFCGALGFAWLIRWAGLSRLWTALLFVSLSVCAAYRTARVGQGPDFGSGPEILSSPQWLDVIPVALGLCAYLLLFEKLNRPAQHAESV